MLISLVRIPDSSLCMRHFIEAHKEHIYSDRFCAGFSVFKDVLVAGCDSGGLRPARLIGRFGRILSFDLEGYKKYSFSIARLFQPRLRLHKSPYYGAHPARGFIFYLERGGFLSYWP